MNTLPHSTGSIHSRAFPSIPAGSVTKFTTLQDIKIFERVGAFCGILESAGDHRVNGVNPAPRTSIHLTAAGKMILSICVVDRHYVLEYKRRNFSTKHRRNA